MKIGGIWQRFSEPSKQLQQFDQRRQAQLLSSLLFILTLFIALMTLIMPALITPDRPFFLAADFQVGAPVALSFAIAYCLSRTKHYRLAAFLVVCIVSIATFTLVVLNDYPNTQDLYVYLIFPILLSGVFLPLPVTAGVIIVNNVGMLLLPAFISPPTLLEVIIGPLPFNILASSLILLAYRHRDLLERDRQAELTRREAELQRRTRELTGLYETALATGSVLEMDALLERLYQQVLLLMTPDTFTVALYRPESDEIKVVLAIEKGESASRAGDGVCCPSSQGGLTGWVIQSGQSLLIGDLQTDPTPIPPKHITAPIRSWLGVPLIAREQLIGAISVQSFRPNAFNEANRHFLTAIAGQVGIAIANARLFERERLFRQQMEAIHQVSLSLTASLELPQVLDAILEAAINLVPALDAHIFLYFDGRLVFGAAMWADGRLVEAFSEPRPGGLTHTVAGSGEMIVVNDMQNHPLFKGVPPDWQGAILGIPLKIGETVLGVMNIAYAKARQFEEAELRILRLLASQAAIAIENARLFEQAQQEITQRKRAEAELQAHQDHLEGVVDERTAELQQAVARLSELDRMKTEFISTAAHELRTPLTSIRGFSEILLNRQLNIERQERFLSLINRESTQLGQIVDDMLDIARLESGRAMEIDMEPVDVGELLKEVASPFVEIAPKHCIHLDGLDAVPLILGDPFRLAQVGKNLLSNAIKYSPDGGDVVLRSRVIAGYIEVSVQDEGVGMTTQQRERIFDKFYRIDASNTAVSGTGLGLAISKLIVEMHGGQIWFESEAGAGATCYFTLPLLV